MITDFVIYRVPAADYQQRWAAVAQRVQSLYTCQLHSLLEAERTNEN
jgi:hypothetical protein